jgi:hypothetical protein
MLWLCCQQCSQCCRAPAGKDTGNTKLTEAQKKKTKILDEDGLLSLVKASAPFAQQEAHRNAATVAAPAAATAAVSARASTLSQAATSKAASAGQSRQGAAPSAQTDGEVVLFFVSIDGRSSSS